MQRLDEPSPGRRVAVHVCLGCGAPLSEIGCKLRCGGCGYFEDCGNGLTPPPVEIVGPVGGPTTTPGVALKPSARPASRV